MKYTKAEVEVTVFNNDEFMTISSGKICELYATIIALGTNNTYECYKVEDGIYNINLDMTQKICHDVTGPDNASTFYCAEITYHINTVVP